MPFSTYLPEEMGHATLSPAGPFETGSFAELTLVYTAGTFGIDDTGMLKITWRTTSDMGKPQLDKPTEPNFTTITASNGAKLDCWVDRVNIRPWANALVIRVGRGYLKAGDTITVKLGDRSRGSPGLRLQTNVEATFELKIFVDAFATYEFTELPKSPEFALVPGPAASWKAIAPSLAVAGEPFRLCLVPEDRWGNPTAEATDTVRLRASAPIRGLPETVTFARGTTGRVIEGLVADAAGDDVAIDVLSSEGRLLCRANPMRVGAKAAVTSGRLARRYWGDLHGQSEETVGTNSADAYFAYARDKAFIDIVGHQGNDFQITDAFWADLNRLTASYEVPGRFLAIPGYEWSGNTGMGGDRNVFYRREGRPIRRSSHILITESAPENAVQYRAEALFKAMQGEDAVVIAHVGGRYADVKVAHDGRLERAVEVHSTWGTFEWIAHDAFDKGYRVGIVAHSDDHKGRPGATRPGASTFGAIGGLTCYLMPELTRDALFAALRARKHYGTSGTRIFLDVQGRFDRPVTLFADDPALGAAASREEREVGIGDIVRPGEAILELSISASGTAPIERIDVMVGRDVVHSVRGGATTATPSRRVRVLWQGAEYRGRGRETLWRGELALGGNSFMRHEAVNFLNPERPLVETVKGTALAWTSVTTGNRAGVDLWLAEPSQGRLTVKTSVVSAEADLATLDDNGISVDGGGLGRRLSIYRLPEAGGPRRLEARCSVRHAGGRDSPVWVRVTQEDGHQAWSSPIYLID
jgi:hypothetical protein